LAKYRQLSIETEAIRLEYRTLIQTPEGAMSAEAGDYLETLRVGDRVHQRIVPAWAFDASHGKCNRRKREQEDVVIGAITTEIDGRQIAQEVVRVLDEGLGMPHDGYPLTRKELPPPIIPLGREESGRY
jgi:hypothetical protein